MEIIITKTFEDLGTTYQVDTRHHVATSVAERYIQHKVAERYKYKSVAERLSSEEAERARLNPVPPASVVWKVVKGAISERYHISAKCSRANCTSVIYDAPPSPSLEALTFCHSCGGSAPEKIPAAVAAQYRNLFKVPAECTADLADYYHKCAKSKGDGEPVDLYAPQKINGVVVGPPVLFDHPVNAKHNNYGHENFQPNPGDGQKADLAPSNPVFKKKP
jgi:hypothetical protein